MELIGRKEGLKKKRKKERFLRKQNFLKNNGIETEKKFSRKRERKKD